MFLQENRRFSATPGGESTLQHDLETQEIVLIETDRDHGELIRQALHKVVPEKTITLFRHGTEAIAHIKRITADNLICGTHEIDLVLIDLNSTRIDGIGILEKIKSDPAMGRIPVVILSAAEGAADIQRAMDLGADEFVIKPFGFPEFTRTIQRIAGTWCIGWRA